MTFRNTSKYADNVVQALVRWVLSNDPECRPYVKKVAVRNRTRAAFSGHCWVSNIVISIGPESKFPAEGSYQGAYKTAPKLMYNDWQEALVAVAAHECQHAWQFGTGRKCSEVDAIWAEHRALNAFRSQRHMVEKEGA